MYIVATFHIGLGLARLLRGYVFNVEPLGPLMYLADFRRWENMAYNVLLCVMTWLGDALVIYRCYFVWSGNLYIIALPTLLLLTTIATNGVVLYWFTHPFSIPIDNAIGLLNSIYPLAFAQNVMTTGLITLKIWNQHRASSAFGVVDRGSRLSLVRIMRIVVESAMVYTIQIFLLVVLYFTGSNAQFIVQPAIVPSIGITFVLIAIRVHLAKRRSMPFESELGTIPAWLAGGDSAIELTHSGFPPVGVSFRVPEEKIGRDDEHTAPSSHEPHKSRHSINGQ
ncbi:hypothetical protein B0H34DRAFT_660497 [Crassisporium funariophilum]|nr:hypothetical protein B0H34DRAFT_660497 [Crassisporium funariophilum]